MNTSDPTSSPPEQQPPRRAVLNVPVFFIALLTPTVLTVLSVLAKSKDIPPFVAFFGGILSGIICGAMLGCRFGRTTGAKVALSVLLVLLLAVACIAMNFGGCMASGFNL